MEDVRDDEHEMDVAISTLQGAAKRVDMAIVDARKASTWMAEIMDRQPDVGDECDLRRICACLSALSDWTTEEIEGVHFAPRILDERMERELEYQDKKNRPGLWSRLLGTK